ncbi:MAG TPA: AraC family transcriptional regulator [Chitinophagaceae bacterium]|nr:AraC family transcriptional regulator [Chitinophagaceae bacterium]
MLEFTFNISERERMLDQLAKQLEVKLHDDVLRFPEKLGVGYMRREKLPNRLDGLIYDFKLNDDFWLNRKKSDKEYYVFICQEVEHNTRLITEVDKSTIETREPRLSHMFLVSFLSDLRQFIPYHSEVRGIRVFISPEWLTGHLRIDKMEDVLQRYLQLKAKSVHMRAMDVESKCLLQEIMNPPEDLHTDVHAYLQNRITMILENFFSWLHQHLGESKGKGISKADIDRMMVVEQQLLADLSCAPSLEDLARSAAVSVTKLKTLFRQVYGLPPYEYFQQHRMLKAKELLLNTALPVNKIGAELGYKNMSNFILAFRKVFHINPGELKAKTPRNA